MNTVIQIIVEDRDMHNSLIYGTLNYPRNRVRAEMFQLDVYLYAVALFLLHANRLILFQQTYNNPDTYVISRLQGIGYWCSTGIEKRY